jgi:hypothetical protein
MDYYEIECYRGFRRLKKRWQILFFIIITLYGELVTTAYKPMVPTRQPEARVARNPEYG